MPRSSTTSRKRKFQGNQFSQSHEISSKKALKFAEVKVDDAKPSGSNQPLSASSRKLQVDLDKTDKKPKLKEQMPEVSGYRLVDLKSLVSAFELVCCQECGQQTVTLRELSFRRKGCASCL